MENNNVARGIDFIVHLFSGGFAGLVSKTLIAPFERTKIILQTQNSNIQILQENKYKGIKDCLRRIVNQQGFFALWKGHLANLLRNFPSSALNFAFKDLYRSITYFILSGTHHKSNKSLQVGLNVLCGGMAGGTTQFILYPLEFVRTRLTADIAKRFNGIGDCFVKIYRAEGVRQFYTGLTTSLCGVVIFRSVYFGSYDSGKQFLFDKNSQNQVFVKLLYAQICTTTASSMSYPFDTVKRKLILQIGNQDKLFTKAAECAKKTYQLYGVRGFYGGFLANLARSFGNAVALVLYDISNDSINKLSEKAN